MKPYHPQLVAWSLEVTATADAYSYRYYGAKAWSACFAVLFQRGYNSTEASAIMRSKLTRLAADGRFTPDDHATPGDLDRLLASFDAPALRAIVDDYVVGINAEDLPASPQAPTRARRRGMIRLVFSRPETPQNAPRAIGAGEGE
jgi:hypothetical protein